MTLAPPPRLRGRRAMPCDAPAGGRRPRPPWARDPWRPAEHVPDKRQAYPAGLRPMMVVLAMIHELGGRAGRLELCREALLSYGWAPGKTYDAARGARASGLVTKSARGTGGIYALTPAAIAVSAIWWPAVRGAAGDHRP